MDQFADAHHGNTTTTFATRQTSKGNSLLALADDGKA
jgi:hypothetical protein